MIEMLDQEILDERIEAILELWGTETDPDINQWIDQDRYRAYEIAAAFPSEIATDLFVEYVEMGILSIG